MTIGIGGAARAATVWLATGAAALLAGVLLAPDLRAAGVAASAPGAFETDLLGVAAAAVLLVVLGAWLVTTLVLVEVLLARLRGRPARVAALPSWARRAALVACGLAVTGVSPAHATDDPSGPDRAAVEAHAGRWPHDGDRRLDGLPYPDRAVGGLLPRRLGSEASATVVVRPGDTLWGLAARRLPATAPDAAVARATARLYHANRAVIGDDPDVIHPGQRLREPSSARPEESS